jgi:hypothetical protein
MAGLFSSRRYYRAWQPAGTAVLLLVLSPDRAWTQEIGSSALAYLETVAWKDSLQTWDEVKSFGGERIIDRVRSEFEPIGIRLPGGHLLFPTMGLKAIWDDNLFLDQGDEKRSDLRTEIDLRAKILSQLPRHMFNLDIGGRFVDFGEFNELDYTDGHVFAEGRIDIDAGNVVGGTVQSSLLHEDRFAAEAPAAAAEAVPFVSNRVEAGFLHDQGRLTALFGMDYRTEDYRDVLSYDGSTLDQDIRDNTLLGSFARFDYRFSPGYSAFVAGRIDRQEFSDTVSQAQNNNGYRIETGVHMELNPLVRFQFDTGYDYHDVDFSDQADTGAFSWRAEMQWLPTDRMTVKLEAKQGIEQSSGGGVFGLLSTTYNGVVQYDVFHNAELKLELTRYEQEFLGTSRLDNSWIAGAQLDYWVNRNAKLTFGYEYRNRDSTDDALDYEDNRFRAGVKISF